MIQWFLCPPDRDVHSLVIRSTCHAHGGVYKAVIANKVGKAACYAHLYVTGKRCGRSQNLNPSGGESDLIKSIIFFSWFSHVTAVKDLLSTASSSCSLTLTV